MTDARYGRLAEYLVQNQGRFYRTAYCYTRDREAALDIVQSAYCKALENYRKLRNPDAVHTWFYRILVNESLTWLKKSKREQVQPAEAMTEIPYRDQDRFEDADLYESIRQLSPEGQTVVMLRYFEDMSLQEIADVTSTNLSTVKTRLYASLKKLKVWIEKEECI